LCFQNPFNNSGVIPGKLARASATRNPGKSKRLIGSGTAFAVPSLQTVRAVLPHTAFQSVVSSSGLARYTLMQRGEPPVCRVKTLAICLFDAVASAANRCSFHRGALIHDRPRPWVSTPCLTLAGTDGVTFCSRCGSHTSTFLPPVPRRSFAFCASHDFRRLGTMKALTPAPLITPSAGLPAYLTTPSCRSVSNHAVCSDTALSTTSACRTTSGLRLSIAGSPQHNAESSSLSYGPTFRLRLLSTPPRGDAVTFGYGAVAYSGTDFHRANVAPSRAHDTRFRGYDVWGAHTHFILRTSIRHTGAWP
jgi:hypothetical protein